MRVRRMLGSLALAGALVGALAASVPAAAVTPLGGETMYWKIGDAGVKGLIAVTLDLSTTVSWQLWGLRANGNYAIAGHGEHCDAAASSPFFLVDFTASAHGVSWDPVTISGTLSSVGSIRIQDLDAGTPLLCADSDDVDTGGPSPSIGVIKLRAPGVRGIGIIDESTSGRTVLSITGLRARTAHKIVLRSAGCGGGTVRTTSTFTSNGRGRALVDKRVFESAAGPSGLGGEVLAGSMRVKRASTSIVCGIPQNRAS